MEIKVITAPINLEELIEIAKNQFGDLVKAVVDVEQEIIAVGGELHADEEQLLVERGSEQRNLWGINLYPQKKQEEWIEFDSMINVKPAFGNRSRNVENPEIREKIKAILTKLIIRE